MKRIREERRHIIEQSKKLQERNKELMHQGILEVESKKNYALDTLHLLDYATSLALDYSESPEDERISSRINSVANLAKARIMATENGYHKTIKINK